MFRIILAFVAVFVLYHFGIQAWRTMTGKERWSTVKCLTYSVFLAIITFVSLSLFVFLF